MSVKESARERAIRRSADAARPRREPEPVTDEEKILIHIGDHPGSTIEETRAATGLSESDAYKLFARLAEGTKLRREGRGWSLVPPFRFIPERPRPVRNISAGRGDVIEIGRHRAAVLDVEWRDHTWAVTHLYLVDNGRRLTQANPVTTTYLPASAPVLAGRWTGDLEPGSPGAVKDLDPSDGSATITQTTGGSAATNNQREANMASTTAAKRTVVRRSAKKTTAAKPAATKTAAKPAATTSNRRSQADIDALVPKFLAAINGGKTMRAVKQEFGFTDDGPIRAALYRAGYDSKGNEHGEVAGSLNPKNKTGVNKLVALRNNEGAGWYRLAFLSGLGESEVKTLVTENGGSAGRVYIASEKPAKSVAKEEGDAEAAAKKTSARKSSGKKVTRRATAADPSK